MVPFFFAASCIGMAFTCRREFVDRIYFFDLIGEAPLSRLDRVQISPEHSTDFGSAPNRQMWHLVRRQFAVPGAAGVEQKPLAQTLQKISDFEVETGFFPGFAVCCALRGLFVAGCTARKAQLAAHIVRDQQRPAVNGYQTAGIADTLIGGRLRNAALGRVLGAGTGRCTQRESQHQNAYL